MNSLRTSSMVTQHSVDAISLCCLTHGSCVEVTGLQSLLTIARWGLLVAHLKKKEIARVLSSVHATPQPAALLDPPVCSMRYNIIFELHEV